MPTLALLTHALTRPTHSDALLRVSSVVLTELDVVWLSDPWPILSSAAADISGMANYPWE
jgi:hypothetical protein